MIKVLHYMYGFCNSKAGVESFVLNLKSRLSPNCSFSILTRNSNSEVKKIFLDNGIEVYDLNVPRLSISNIMFYTKKLNDFFSIYNDFNFLHTHGTDDPFIVSIAKKHGIKQVACHVHAIGRENQSSINNLVKNLFAVTNIGNADYLFACSQKAGESFYGSKKFTVIKNGIDTKRYRYNQKERNKTRNMLRLSNEEVAFCFVGRLTQVKNLYFLIDIFSSLMNLQNNIKLFIAGDGELAQPLKDYCREKKIEYQVVFLGNVNEVPSLLSSMDVYIQTSFKEGFSLSSLEAQCSGLPTFLSTGFPIEIEVTNLVNRLDLNMGADSWANYIHDYLRTYDDSVRINYSSYVRNEGYDIQDITRSIEENYYAIKSKNK